MTFTIKKALLLVSGYLSFFQHPHGTSAFVASATAMNQNGRWEVIDSNDPLVNRLAHPRIVEILPSSFRIGKNIFGSFKIEPSPPSGGIHVSMTMYGIRWLKKIYVLEPLEVDRMALFGTGSRASTYYILRRWTSLK